MVKLKSLSTKNDDDNKSLLFIDELSSKIKINANVSNQLSKKLSGLDPENVEPLSELTPGLRVNAQGFRSDEFHTSHDGSHILFSGCSATFGMGLFEEELWSSRLIRKISASGEKVSGTFNLAKPGTGVFEIVSNIFRYCGEYGNPDSIFVQLPNLTRFYAFDRKSEKVRHADLPHTKDLKDPVLESGFKRQIEINAYQYLMMLETFCKINGINLFVFSWQSESYFSANPDLDSFNILSATRLADHVNNYMRDNPDDEFAMTARDNMHHGNAHHSYWSDLAFNIYSTSKKKWQAESNDN